jgi:hypothetical protein
MKYILVIEIKGTGKSVSKVLKDGLQDKLKEIENKVKAIKGVVCPTPLVYTPQEVNVGSLGGMEPHMEDTWEISIEKGFDVLEVLSKIKDIIQAEKFN